MDEQVELQMLRTASRASKTGAWRWFLKEDRVEWTEVTHQLFEVAAETLIDLRLAMSFYDDESLTRLMPAIELCQETGTPWDLVLRCRTSSGNAFWARSIGNAVRSEDGVIVALEGAFQDITSERDALSAQALAEDELSSVLNTMPDGFFLLDENWEFVFLNPASQSMLQRKPETLIGCNVWKEFPEAKDSVFEEVYGRVMANGGSESFTAYFAPLETWFFVSAHRAQRGVAVHFRDITDARRIEEEQRKTERLALLGQMAGGVSHDFNNLLSVILGNVELIEFANSPSERSELIKEACAAVQRGQSLNESLLAFSGRSRLEPVTEDLGEFVKSLEPLLKRTLTSRISMFLEIEPNLPQALLDSTMAESCLLNLVINARDAIEGSGNVQITLQRAEEPVGSEYKPGPWVRLAVADTGCGIPLELHERVFEPFFTSRGPALHSGLGLSRVKGFAEQMGGFVTLQSQEGKGTEVAMYFPVASLRVSRGESLVPTTASSGRSLRVLVVDDTPAVARVAARMLAALGCSAHAVHDASAARSAIQEKGPFDVLLTDVIMPSENGIDLARKLRAENPNLRAILMSGYPDKALGEDLLEGIVFLRKPIGRRDLARAIRDLEFGFDDAPRNRALEHPAFL